jgi:hypothetical protein
VLVWKDGEDACKAHNASVKDGWKADVAAWEEERDLTKKE